jgi:hypothetical protein
MSFTSDNLTFAKSYLDCYEKALNKTQTLVWVNFSHNILGR